MNLNPKNPYESREEPLNEIAKKVNAFLDPILEERFDLKSRKEYVKANNEDLSQKQRQIGDRITNLGLTYIDQKAAKDLLEADSEFKKIDKIIKETKPSYGISPDLAEKIKKYDPDGKLEKEISRIYGLKPGLSSWRVFLVFLGAILPDDPCYWDELKKESESEK